MYLNKYNSLKLEVNNNGLIAVVKKQENGRWINDRNLPNILNKLSNNYKFKKNITIILKQ
jgi:hypothetical protein